MDSDSISAGQGRSIIETESFMEKLNVLLVEDEMIIAADVKAHLGDIGVRDITIVRSGEAALAYLEKNKVQLILMDISLDGELDGIDTAAIVRDKYDIPLIFLTANTDDATFRRAKATIPFAFIEKPFKKRRLIRTIELFLEHALAEPEQEASGSVFLADRIFVRDRNGLSKVALDDVLWLEADRAYCKIMTSDREFVVSSAMGALEKNIENPLLRRVHRSYIVNISKIDRIEQSVLVVNGSVIPLSKTYQEDLMQALQIL